ncbi:hypothetical protein [Clostridium beijerinckii]|uniref:hypothetical protein n=1 Tax=Clostridium beijerinckii TaxID=1520 RepID=UPI001570098C|nr:hypothetical protein [Clostridium beijerinckii]NRY40091.1 hypothetical protein [Clostridium beijerinckii]
MLTSTISFKDFLNIYDKYENEKSSPVSKHHSIKEELSIKRLSHINYKNHEMGNGRGAQGAFIDFSKYIFKKYGEDPIKKAGVNLIKEQKTPKYVLISREHNLWVLPDFRDTDLMYKCCKIASNIDKLELNQYTFIYQSEQINNKEYQYNIENIPYMQIVPMSSDDEEFKGKSVEEVQSDYFLGKLKESGIYYFNQGISATASSNILLLFQFKKKIIAIALLEKVEKDNVSSRMYVLPDSIRAIKPVTEAERLRQICEIDEKVGYNTWKVIEKKYLKAVLLLLSNQSSNVYEKESDESTMEVKNFILYGPPGTGKTYSVFESAVKIIDTKSLSDDRDSNIEKFKQFKREGKIEFCTFHQSYSYEEFIEGFRYDIEKGIPVVQDGIFKRMCIKAAFSALKKSKGFISKELAFENAYNYIVRSGKEKDIKFKN